MTPLSVAVLGIVAVAVIAVALVFAAPTATRHDLIRVGPLRRAMRAVRAWAVRGAVLPIGWPHLVDLYRGNTLFGEKLGAIPQSMLLCIAERDHLVPAGASHALTTIPGLDTTVVNVASGHESMVVGSAAKATVWPALVDFLRAQQR